MAISFKDNKFHLTGGSMSYIIMIGSGGDILNLYFGKSVDADDMFLPQKAQATFGCEDPTGVRNYSISVAPLEYPSAGSTFKRPEGYFAGALIEECGLKGKSVGGAQVSVKHAGFVINKGGASCQDVLDLCKYCSDTVFKEKGVKLEMEIRVTK